ncbi:MAG TPA: hypothetical protein VF214_05240 [Edaphobacter sp.]
MIELVSDGLKSVVVKLEVKESVSRRFSALVTEIHEQSRTAGRQLWQVALDRTEFAVGDEGTLEAVARSGARLVVPVLSVEVGAAGEVWHMLEKPLTIGTDVTGCVTARRTFERLDSY